MADWEAGLGDITTHPMWEAQVRLEYGMRQHGVDASERRRATAESRDQMTRLTPVRGLVTEWLPVVTKQLVDWLDACKRSRGVTPLAASYLRARPEKLCLANHHHLSVMEQVACQPA